MISTSLYFVVFGAAIGTRIPEIEGVAYGAFIVPGLIMLMLLTQSIANASFGIYFPKFIGTIYELLSAPVSYVEIVLGYVGAAATKSIILGLIILATAGLFVPLRIEHPFWMLAFLVLTAVTFSLFGFIIGIWADSFEKLQVIPLLIITPLTFLGGTFYSINVLPPIWQTIALFNPVVYLVSGFRWSFYEFSDVHRRRQPRHDAAVPGAVPGHSLVDFPDGLSPQELNALGCARQAAEPPQTTSGGLDAPPHHRYFRRPEGRHRLRSALHAAADQLCGSQGGSRELPSSVRRAGEGLAQWRGARGRKCADSRPTTARISTRHTISTRRWTVASRR